MVSTLTTVCSWHNYWLHGRFLLDSP
uniref:Uncharacterized protein n=1 Tax=Rhizophora mucronata TaxID=61149 RepID=A0A2P2QIH9_RHIMU